MLVLLLCVLADDDDSLSNTKSCHLGHSPHKLADGRHLLPLSVEAQFVRDIVDQVSSVFCVIYIKFSCCCVLCVVSL